MLVLVIGIGAEVGTVVIGPPVELIAGELPKLVAANFYFEVAETAASTVVSVGLQACSLSVSD